MKRLLCLFTALVPLLCPAQNPRQDYIGKYSALAVSEMRRTGVPASITLAQGLVESGAGESPLAVHANNHFGIKCHNDWQGGTYYKDDDREQECFRVFPTVEDSFRAHSDFLRERGRYQSLFELEPTDYKGWARGLKRAGYATDPLYADKLIKLIEELQLYRFDTLADDAAAPGEITLPPSPPVILEEGTPARENEEPGPEAEEKEPETGWQGYAESVSLSFARETWQQNGVPYVRSIEGETWESLAGTYGLFLRQLLSYNDLSEPTALDPGTRVYLARKKAQAEPGHRQYLVEQEGETLWDVSQKFGIQLKKLRLYNARYADTPLKPGDTVLLRKP